MPLYEFECKKCGSISERIVSRDIIEIKCPVCKENAKKIISSSHFIINGFSEKNGYSKVSI